MKKEWNEQNQDKTKRKTKSNEIKTARIVNDCCVKMNGWWFTFCVLRERERLMIVGKQKERKNTCKKKVLLGVSSLVK